MIGEDHIGSDKVGARARRQHLLRRRAWAPGCGSSTSLDGAAVFGYRVADPTAYGVVEFDDERRGALPRGEARRSRKSNYAVPGLYFYDNDVVGYREGPASRPRVASWRSRT